MLLAQLDVTGDDLGGNDPIDDAIELSEQRVWADPDLKFAEEEQALGVAISNNVAILPADFEQFHTVSLNSGPPLDILPVEVIRGLIVRNSNSCDSFVAIEGLNAIFFPIASGMMTGTYFRRLVPFRDDPSVINGLYSRFPRLMIFAALKELADLVGIASRSAEFELKFSNPQTGDGEKERTIRREYNRRYMGRRLVRGNSTNFIERNRLHLSGVPGVAGPSTGGGQIVLPGDFVVAITGSLSGTVFGSSPYGVNSDLSAAAVHAGLVAPGDSAMILVHYVGAVSSFSGTTAHGVTSEPQAAGDGLVLSIANTTGIPVMQDVGGHWSPLTFTAVTS